MHLWYKLFTYLFYPFSPIYLYFRKLRKKENSKSCKEKLAKINIPRGDGFLVWFHVASVGEAMSILPLIEGLLKEEKISKILITSITLSSGKILGRKFDQNTKVFHQFLPFDVPILTNKFLEHWKPNLSIFIDSEIWPNIIFQLNKKKIPLLLLNARITNKTFKKWKLLSKFSKSVFEKFDLCIASNKESENFLKILGAKNIKNYGNLKFVGAKNNLNKKFDSTFLNQIKDRKIWCAASTHSPEEIFSAKSHITIKKNYKNVLTIIIPRHINRIKKIEKDLSSFNLRVILSSQLNNLDDSTDILLVNSYGEALKFYNISKCVFMGKSLVQSLTADSGQNPIEPARLGCKILHGPNVSNFREIYDFLTKLNFAKEINNSEDLSLSIVEEFKKDREKSVEIVEKIENYGSNIFNNVVKELKKYI